MNDFRFHGLVDIQLGSVKLKGDLIIPVDALQIIVFSHGSGSSRLSRRNREVAHYFHSKNFGTLLFDLLTEEEDRIVENRFDINLLALRLIETTAWLENHSEAKWCQFGYYGASTGAASAIIAASNLPNIKAVVSRGGRPDLADEELANLSSPTLLLVGSLDTDVIELNRWAYKQMNCIKKIIIIEGASHLFEEPGKMEIISELAYDWFHKYLLPIQTL